MHTYTPNQSPYEVLTFYTLQNPRNSPDKILQLIVTTTRSNQDQTMMLHTYTTLTNIPTKYQLPTPYSIWYIAQTRFYRSRSLWQGQRLNQGHTMTMHTYNPPTNVATKYYLPTPYSFQDIARTRFYRSRSLRQGQRSNQGHTMTLHTYNPQCPSQVSTSYTLRFPRYSQDKIFKLKVS